MVRSHSNTRFAGMRVCAVYVSLIPRGATLSTLTEQEKEDTNAFCLIEMRVPLRLSMV